MKSQAYPASRIKVGAVLYSVFAWTDDDTGKSHVDIDEWHVRSIQNRKRYALSDEREMTVNIVHKCEYVTWENEEWKKNIPPRFRHKFRVGDNLPYGIYTTQSAALRCALDKKKESVVWYQERQDTEEWSAEHAEEQQNVLKELKLIKSRITRIKNSKIKSAEQ